MALGVCALGGDAVCFTERGSSVPGWLCAAILFLIVQGVDTGSYVYWISIRSTFSHFRLGDFEPFSKEP